MTQTLPLSLTLGSANAGKLIGYTVLALDRTEYAAFTLATEGDVPGTYYALDGYVAPDAGGYLVVSESDDGDPAVLTAMVETDIEPSGLTALAVVDANVDAIKLVTDAIDVSAVTITTTNNAGELTIKRSATFTATVSGLTIPSDWLAVIWTVKGAASDDDDDAVCQVRVSNPAELTDGLQRIDGGLPTGLSLTAADGSATVNQPGGSVALALKAAATAVLDPRGDGVWDLKVLRPPAGEADELTTGTADIVYTVTHART